MKPAKTDPKVCCPIVCGEYMRATGFFFVSTSQTYLVTARHNVLPVDAHNLATGELELTYSTKDRLPTIDIYLRKGSQYTCNRTSLFEQSGVCFHNEIDVIGIPVDFDPTNYGYTVWTPDDIVTNDSTQTMADSIGYSGASFPSCEEYDSEIYCQELTNPYMITLRNEYGTHPNVPTDTGLINISIDRNSTEQTKDYTGYSGSPILSDGLLGIHFADLPIYTIQPDTTETTQYSGIAHWNAGILPKLLK